MLPPLSIRKLLESPYIEKAFTCLYFLLKNKISHTINFEPLLDLFSFLGVNIKEQIRTARNATYTSDKSIQEMVFILSEVIESKILNDKRSSDHFAIMMDETTDCCVIEQMAIHGRFIEKGSGNLRSHFLKVIDVLQPEINPEDNAEATQNIGLNAETITKRVIEFITQAELDLKKLRGIGTDGAATMVGCRTGVVTRLKAIAPSAIGVHCASHRLI